MKNIPIQYINKIKKAIPRIEDRLKVKINLNKNSITVRGKEFDEFLVNKIIQAVEFGFHIEDALLLTKDEFILEFIEVKEHTHRNNLREVRARLIGTKGKARKTIESLTGAVIVINNNDVGVIVDADHLDATMQAIESLIHGAKHGNIFSYLEKQNKTKKAFDEDDLGLKEGIQ